MNVKLKKILAMILSVCLFFSGLTFFKGMETNAADKGDDTMNILFIGNSMTYYNTLCSVVEAVLQIITDIKLSVQQQQTVAIHLSEMQKPIM